MSAEPVPGVVLSADGQPTLVVRGNEDMHVWNAGAQRLYTRAALDAALDAAVAAARAEERCGREAAEWRENFAVLQRALVGDTGLSGITVAAELRRDAERYRWLRQRYETLCRMGPARALGLDLSRVYVNAAEKFDDVLDAAIRNLKPEGK